MKLKLLAVSLVLCVGVAEARTGVADGTDGVDDPVIMTIAGRQVTRSEFEYSYNRYNGRNVIDRKTVAEYVPLFVNYKLKAQAAVDAGIDTTRAFSAALDDLLAGYAWESFDGDPDIEADAREYYRNMRAAVGDRGLYSCSQILIRVPQDATNEEQGRARMRIDSVYNALMSGADVTDLARRLSQDTASARRGGRLESMMMYGDMVPEFESVAYSLHEGEVSRPFQTVFGYHIIKMHKRVPMPSYDSIRTDIVRYIERRNYREAVASENVKPRNLQHTVDIDTAYKNRIAELEARNPDLRWLIQDYRDGLLVAAITDSLVSDRAARDETGLQRYFKANKKKYKWSAPRGRDGKKKKSPKRLDDVREYVIDDYQKELEKEWTDRLRAKYPVSIDASVVATVNKH